MGRRSRKRSVSDAPRPEADKGTERSARSDAPTRAERDAERRRRRAEEDAGSGTGARARSRPRGTGERPQPPWGSFPLTELVVLLALVLGSLAGLELAVREHFAGYRSHTTLLAACAAFVAGVVMVLAVTGPTARVPVLVVALAIFAVAFYLLREAFKRRSGGLGFR